jgi:hypothetical protein
VRGCSEVPVCLWPPSSRNLEDLCIDEVIEQFDVTRKQVTGVLDCRRHLAPALAQFDKVLPDLDKMRDVAEHVGDYAIEQPPGSSLRQIAGLRRAV